MVYSGDLMRIYHVATGSTSAETEAIRRAKPPYLLLSYYYFRNKSLKDFIEKLGYKPEEVMLDSGAYSAWTKEKGIALTDYIKFIENNKNYISCFLNLDVVQDNEMSFDYFCILKKKGYSPIPVVQYEEDYEKWFKKYYDLGERFIALGGTVLVKSKSDVSNWVRILTWQFPEVKIHLLGSSSRRIIDHCDLFSCDSSTWYMQAVNGRPYHIKGHSKEKKIQRAVFNIQQEMNLISKSEFR